MNHSCHNTPAPQASAPLPRVSPDDKGFSLVEVIAVLILLGILSAIALSHSNSLGVDAELSGAAEVVKGHLRFAQTTAMNSDLAWGIDFNGSTYTLQNANAVTAPLPTALPDNVTVVSTVDPLMFDNRWGSPGAATITVTVSRAGIDRSFTVTKNTGFIP